MSVEVQEILAVNLSAVHTLHPIATGIDAFGHLYRPSDNKKESCCQNLFNFFTTLYDRAWVSKIYYANLNMITDYKKGNITTEVFLENMLNIFSFLKDKPHAKELLINAWNAIVNVTEHDEAKLAYLKSHNLPVYFFSNTNELNATAIFDAFLGANPSRDLSHNPNKEKIIEIEEGIYFAPSYRWGCFKTTGLIAGLKDHPALKGKRINIVSQFQPDLDTARSLGLDIFTAAQFFDSVDIKLKKT